jgi:hypothetical protein
MERTMSLTEQVNADIAERIARFEQGFTRLSAASDAEITLFLSGVTDEAARACREMADALEDNLGKVLPYEEAIYDRVNSGNLNIGPKPLLDRIETLAADEDLNEDAIAILANSQPYLLTPEDFSAKEIATIKRLLGPLGLE